MILTCFRKQRARNGADSGERNAPVQPRHFEHVDCGPIAQVDTVRVCGPVWPCAALCGPVRPCVALCGPVRPIGLFPEVLLDYSPRAYWIIPRGPIGLFPEVLLDYSPLSLCLRFSNILFWTCFFKKTTRRRQRGQRRPQLLKYRNIKIPKNT